MFNDGNGRFDGGREFEGTWPGLSVMLADYSGNGLADILLEFGGGGIVYYINQGDDGFQQNDLTPSAPVGVMRLHPVAGDLNGDGHLDLFAAGCCGREANMSVPPLNDYLLPYSQVWLNQGDGRLDIFVAGVTSYQVWRGEGNGRFTADPRADYR